MLHTHVNIAIFLCDVVMKLCGECFFVFVLVNQKNSISSGHCCSWAKMAWIQLFTLKWNFVWHSFCTRFFVVIRKWEMLIRLRIVATEKDNKTHIYLWWCMGKFPYMKITFVDSSFYRSAFCSFIFNKLNTIN